MIATMHCCHACLSFPVGKLDECRLERPYSYEKGGSRPIAIEETKTMPDRGQGRRLYDFTGN